MSQQYNAKTLDEKIAYFERKLVLFASLNVNTEEYVQFVKSLYKIVPAPMFYKDIKGLYRHCNDAFAETILGIEKDQIIGKSLYDLNDEIPKENADIYHANDMEILNTAGQQSYETKVKCTDGVERYYHFYKSAFVVNKETRGLTGLMIDISEYSRMVKELDKINTALNRSEITDWLAKLNKLEKMKKGE
jgi:PAS domain S-box-containing protein